MKRGWQAVETYVWDLVIRLKGRRQTVSLYKSNNFYKSSFKNNCLPWCTSPMKDKKTDARVIKTKQRIGNDF